MKVRTKKLITGFLLTLLVLMSAQMVQSLRALRDALAAVPCPVVEVDELIPPEPKEETTESPTAMTPVIEPVLMEEPEPVIEEGPEQVVEEAPESLGEFKLTAYCSCPICCKEWAYNRPVDENGREVVYGSIGRELKVGRSIAVDPDVIPYGTEVTINGHTYVAEDTGVSGHHIDVYFDDHQEALEFGVKYAEVYK